ncbi:MAG TPA: preprotein translocase subunit YajC [Terriglobales bacterium]|nr:preprotein translocase subunit YajC [Terriglobales bacterium]
MIELHPISCLLAQSSGSAIFGVVPLIAIFAIFYVMLILPQQKRQKKWQQMLSALKNGDRVVTSGGIRGTIISVRDDAVQLRVPPDNLRIEVARSAVTALANPEEAK